MRCIKKKGIAILTMEQKSNQLYNHYKKCYYNNNKEYPCKKTSKRTSTRVGVVEKSLVEKPTNFIWCCYKRTVSSGQICKASQPLFHNLDVSSVETLLIQVNLRHIITHNA